MESFYSYSLASWCLIFWLPFLAWMVVRGRMEVVLGIYLVTGGWGMQVTIPIFGRNVPLLWFVVPFLIPGCIYCYLKNKPKIIYPNDNNAVICFAFWVAWMSIIAVGYGFPENYGRATAIGILFRFTIPMFALVLTLGNLQQIRWLAFSFVVTAIPLGCLLVSKSNQFKDLDWGTIAAAGGDEFVYNYHFCGWITGLALVFSCILFVDSGFGRLKLKAFVFPPILGVLCYILLTTSSRQTMVAITFALLLFCFLVMRFSLKSLVPILLVVFAIGVGGYLLIAEDLGRLRLEKVVADFFGRIDLYKIMWEWFLKSPLTGNGLVYDPGYNHNLFLDILAGQGVIGLVLMCGVLFAFARFGRRLASRSDNVSIDLWRKGLLAAALFVFIPQMVTGGVLSAHPLLWVGLSIRSLYYISAAQERNRPKTLRLLRINAAQSQNAATEDGLDNKAASAHSTATSFIKYEPSATF